ncbi:MAG TPA: hypothetical protein DDY91_15775 [Planctomycetaceae bacterium]|nr:hypothetical protein [Planctomycetaceae bacterium]
MFVRNALLPTCDVVQVDQSNDVSSIKTGDPAPGNQSPDFVPLRLITRTHFIVPRPMPPDE